MTPEELREAMYITCGRLQDLGLWNTHKCCRKCHESWHYYAEGHDIDTTLLRTGHVWLNCYPAWAAVTPERVADRIEEIMNG